MLYGDLTFSAKVPPESGIDAAALFLPQLPRSAINRSKKSLVYEHMPIVSTTAESFREFAIFDFDPKLPKRAVQITGKAELEEDGSNLALILKRVTEDPEKNRMFSNLVSDLLPFVENIGVEKFSDKSMLFKVREKYCSRDFVPASMVSDGTITVALLVLALFFVSKPTIVIEEPERNLHPALIGPLVSMMKDASKTRQIIVTTHNPLLVKHAGIENLLLVSRDQKGFSVIVRPRDKQEVRTFLENEIGIDELFTQNLLEL
jgi:predicted ATPase